MAVSALLLSSTHKTYYFSENNLVPPFYFTEMFSITSSSGNQAYRKQISSIFCVTLVSILRNAHI